MKRLILFDVDGTLCNTVKIDDICMQRALTDVLGVPVESIEPFSGDHATDTGVTREAFRILKNRGATSSDVERVRLAFMRHLESAYRSSPTSFEEVPGARTAFHSVAAHKQWGAALASGAWWQSAELKLRGIGIDPDLFPGAFAEDSPNREQIINTAIDRASMRYRILSWDHIVYVGDGKWDVRAARNMNIGFVGVGRGELREMLIQEGAMNVIDNFVRSDTFVSAVENAAIPAGRILVTSV